MKRSRAFTLMELMVAMAMATAIGTAAVMSGMQIQRTMAATRKHVVVWDEAKRVEEALLTLLQEAGGSPLSPAQAIVVEQNTCGPIVGAVTIPGCAGQDRVTITNIQTTFQKTTGELAPLPTCIVTSVSGNVLNLATTGGQCTCLFPEDFATKGLANDERSPYERRQAILVRDSDGALVPLNLRETQAGCRINVPTGAGNPGPGALGPGKLVAITRRVLFAVPDPSDPGALQLQVWLDRRQGLVEANGQPDANEVELFADHLYAFEVALGYDGGNDGTVNDASSTTDDWVGNVVGDTRPTAISDDGLLRMVGVGIIVGGRSERFDSKTLRVFDSAPTAMPDIYLVAMQSKVALRNLNISLP